MTITPDALAATYEPDGADPQTEIQSLADMAAEYGYRLVPLHSDEMPSGSIPPPFPDNPDDMLRRMIWLTAAVKASGAAHKAYKQEKAALSERLVDNWVERGKRSDSIDDYTGFLAPTYTYAKNDPETTTQDLIDALKASGLGYMIQTSFSYQSLLAMLKEMDEQSIPIPEKLSELITLKKGHEVRVTPAGRKKSAAKSARST